MPDPLTFLDLFCGCGGFTLGLQRAGLRCLAAIDNSEEAIEVFKSNFSKDVPAILEDLRKYSPDKLAAKLGVNSADIIVGGPPCQGFSTVRQVNASNHGRRVRKDKRRYLFRSYLQYVAAFRPRVFIMENVLGIQSAAKGKFFTLVQSEARKLGYRIQAQVEQAWTLGVPQKRRRQLIIGVRNDVAGYFPSELRPAKRITSHLSPKLWDAIGDLPPLSAGGNKLNYDHQRRSAHVAQRGTAARHYIETVLEIEKATALTGHEARPHSARDLRDFARLREGEHSGEAEARGEKMEFTYTRTCFQDRYKRQAREDFCSTIVAHLSKDGLGFIHPTQDRSLTPREAARIQGFPDWFLFPVARTHQFRLIGNAIPPLIAEAVGEELVSLFQSPRSKNNGLGHDTQSFPKTDDEAVQWLRSLLDVSPRSLERIDQKEFNRAWFAVAFLFPSLHPGGALDHGETICRNTVQNYFRTSALDRRLLAPCYARSGWPVILAPIAREAWKRYRKEKMTEKEFYCGEAQVAGKSFRAALTSSTKTIETLYQRN